MKEVYSTVSLNGTDWCIRRDAAGAGYDEMLRELGGWVPATVPGNVQADLEAAGLLPPIRYGAIDPLLYDVPMADWWYLRRFTAPALPAGGRMTLVFGGVDFSCEVYLNGTLLGRHDGMFERFALDATDAAVPGGENTLAVKIFRMPAELMPWVVNSDGKLSGNGTDYFFVEANNRIRRTLKGLKCPANMSYDWSTNVYTLGIWKDVALEVTGPARIKWLQVDACPDDGLQSARVHVRLEAEGAAEGALAEAEVEGRVYPLGAVRDGVAEGTFTLEQARLWWPAGMGAQSLYGLTARLVAGDVVSDSKSTRFGVRRVEWALAEGAPGPDFPNRLQLVLNGRPVRTMGSNLMTPDLLFGRSAGKGRHYVELARRANMNTLREHGGQIIFHDDIYDACDEYGIMLLVDYPVGNCILEGDAPFLANMTRTVDNIVRQLYNHPAIVEWTGGNELDYYFNPDVDRTGIEAMRRACENADPTRVFRDTCPIAGSRHAPWDYNMDITYPYFNSELTDNLGKVSLMRYGEFGTQTPGNVETWYSDFPAASRWPLNDDDPVQVRKNARWGCFGNDSWFALEPIEALFGKQQGLEQAVRTGQFVAAEGLRYMMDALRARGKKTCGFTNWDYNEPFPNGAGSYLVDYDGRPVMAYYWVQQALAPVALQLRYDHILFDFYGRSVARLRLVSDAPDTREGLAWSCVMFDRNGAEYGRYEGVAAVEPHGVVDLGEIAVTPPTKNLFGPVFARLTLRDAGGALLAERLYPFGARGMRAPLGGIFREDATQHDYGVPYVTTGIYGGYVKRARLELAETKYSRGRDGERLELTVHNPSEMTAFFVEVHALLAYRPRLYVEGNFCFVPPGERRTITIYSDGTDGLSLEQTGFRLHTWNVPEDIIVPPAASVVAWMGRQDATCHAYAQAGGGSPEVLADGRRFAESAVAYLLAGSQAFIFRAPGGALALRVHTADQSAMGAAVEVLLNDTALETVTLPGGQGRQRADREHLACPKSFTVALPAGAVADGQNRLALRMVYGWVSWDAMEIVSE